MQIIYRSPNSEKEFEDYFTFRWELLRKPLGFKRGSEQDELENTAFQLAAFNNKIIIAVGRLHIEKNNTARIRYMAVDSAFRKQGVGSRLLNKLEKYAIEKNIGSCWLYARETAAPFYTKNHYNIIGEAISKLEIPHQRMQKIL
ncbi:MAG: GNAT family N-acetyltransferase [Gammaproteobacteria bacterium]|nr:MAG: GNAT family N-acetyltransferase [Gammaproteobacteria bacterium]